MTGPCACRASLPAWSGVRGVTRARGGRRCAAWGAWEAEQRWRMCGSDTGGVWGGGWRGGSGCRISTRPGHIGLGGTCSAERARSVGTGVSRVACGTHGVWGPCARRLLRSKCSRLWVQRGRAVLGGGVRVSCLRAAEAVRVCVSCVPAVGPCGSGGAFGKAAGPSLAAW